MTDNRCSPGATRALNEAVALIGVCEPMGAPLANVVARLRLIVADLTDVAAGPAMTSGEDGLPKNEQELSLFIWEVQSLPDAERKAKLLWPLLSPAQASPHSKAEWFCEWLQGFLTRVTGRDELDAFDANTIRNTLNEAMGSPSLSSPDHECLADMTLAHNARLAAIEECARVADDFACEDVAKAIRNLAVSPTNRGGEA